MRTLKNTLGTILMATLVLTSCNTIDDDQEFLDIPATPQEFQNLKEEALGKLKQEFEFNTEAKDGKTFVRAGYGVTLIGLIVTVVLIFIWFLAIIPIILWLLKWDTVKKEIKASLEQKA